jgi:uncharacterized peroxidase-related enzyme
MCVKGSWGEFGGAFVLPFTTRMSLFSSLENTVSCSVLEDFMLKTQPRISRVRRSEATDDVAAIYDRYMRTRGNVPNMFRTMAHRPEIFTTMIAHFEATLTTGTLPTKLKELVVVRTSQLNGCEYCLGSHTQIAMKLGWSKEQLDDLANYQIRDDFTPAEKAALSLAEQMTLDSNHIPDEFSIASAISTTRARWWNSWRPSAFSTTSTASTMHCKSTRQG